MTPRYAKLLLLVLLALALYKIFRHYGISQTDLEDDPSLMHKVKVSVYYEALCPDSKFFIKYQLLPVYEEFQDNIILDLVPYGKAQVNKYFFININFFINLCIL